MTPCETPQPLALHAGLCQFLAILLLSLAYAVPAMAADDRPNILYIFTDDQTFRTVSCYPGAFPFANTPNIDRLAEQGVRFDFAYIGAKCSPSRAMQATGRQQFNIINALPPEGTPKDRRVPKYWWQTMREAGYFTGMTGKKHWWDERPGEDWDWVAAWDRTVEGSSYYEGTHVRINGADPIPLGGYSTDRYTDLTVEFIEQRAANPDQPWYFWLCYGAVHGPYTPADRHKGMLDDAPPPPIPSDIYGPRPTKPTHFQNNSAWNPQEARDARWMTEEHKKWMGDKPAPNGMPIYHRNTLESWVKLQTEAVAAIDEGVGRLIEALEKTGQLDNTIIVFTSDQGYVWGHHGLKGKIDPYDDAIRAPLIVSNPKRFAKGKVCRSPVNGPDMVRSFHAWAGVEPDTVVTGRDITPLVKDPESEAVFTEWNKIPTLMTYVKNRYDPFEMEKRLRAKDWADCLYDGGDKKDKKKGAGGVPSTARPWYFLIHNGTYKYIYYANPDRIEELYDSAADFEELNNLAVDPKYKDVLLEMREACRKEIARSGGGPFVPHLPEPRMAY